MSDEQPPTSQGQISPDGQYLWNGTAWVPNTNGAPGAPANPTNAGEAARPWYKKKRWIGAIVIVAIIVIASATGSGGSNDDSKNSADGPVATPLTEDSQPTKAAEPRPTKKSNPVLLRTSGNGANTTEKFKAGSDWDIAYTFDCSAANGVDIFQLYIYNGDGDLTGVGANTQARKGNEVTHQHDSGTHYVQVNSACKWTLKVTDAS
jgi:hypothetical protein